MPNFGSKQPGNTYYYSSLGIYLFGTVSPFVSSNLLFALYFTQGEGAKGGNNVSSLLWNFFKLSRFMEKTNDEGLLG